MKTKLTVLVLIALFSFTISAQNEQKAPLRFNVEKTFVNIEKISAQGLDVQLKGNIIAKINDNEYTFKDETGQMQIITTPEQISEIGEFTDTNIFYIVGKIEDAHKKTFRVSKITKIE